MDPSIRHAAAPKRPLAAAAHDKRRSHPVAVVVIVTKSTVIRDTEGRRPSVRVAARRRWCSAGAQTPVRRRTSQIFRVRVFPD